ncbi:MAG TPA: ribosome maturation factor RimM [Gemmatimonadales bacterium]
MLRERDAEAARFGLTLSAPTHLAVGLLKKPHGVKGDVLILPLTDVPEQVFTEGRVLAVLDKQGRTTGNELVVVKSRAYHRAWLLHFKGIETREAMDSVKGRVLGIQVGEARPLSEGEFYLHELVGMAVELKDKSPVGTTHSVYEAPQGLLLGVRSETGKEHLIPFNADMVRRVDRGERRITITPPEGLLEL